MGRNIKPVLCATKNVLFGTETCSQTPSPAHSLPLPTLAAGNAGEWDKMRHFTVSELHLSFCHLFSAYLSMFFRPSFKGQIKEQHGKTKETQECFILKKPFSRVLALKCLPSNFHFVVLGFCVFKHTPLVISTPCAISSVRNRDLTL